MTAVMPTQRLLAAMATSDLDGVMRIERASYEFPWTRGNFVDSLAAGYCAQVLELSGTRPAGYFVAMRGLEEMHLLNLTVDAPHTGAGHARFMLDSLVTACRAMPVKELWLEVRISNERAQALYRRYGFRDSGVRRGYYPAALGKREDAVVMTLDIA